MLCALIAAAATPAAELANAIRTAGFAVLPRAVSPGLVVSARTAVTERLNTLLDAVDRAGGDVLEQQYSFAEVTLTSLACETRGHAHARGHALTWACTRKCR